MLKKICICNRTLLELEAGILVWGVLWQIGGVWLVKDPVAYCAGLWIGVGIALLAGLHMWMTLDRAFSGVWGDVARRVTGANLLRYGAILAVFALVIAGNIGYPLMTLAGIMGLKAGAYLQPLTHRVSERFFCKTQEVKG